MTNQELCLLLESIIGMLESGNTEKAIQILKNGVERIDKGQTASERSAENEKK